MINIIIKSTHYASETTVTLNLFRDPANRSVSIHYKAKLINAATKLCLLKSVWC